MKKSILFMVFIVAFAASVNAQRVVALHSAGGVSVFSGPSPFVEAYNAAQPGDTIYLSGGVFANPPLFDKRLLIFGAGYHPNFTTATNPTMLTGHFNLGENSDNSVIEGIHFANAIVGGNNVSASFLTFKRCRIDQGLNFQGNLSNPAVNNVFAECIIIGDNALHNAANFSITNSIINYRFQNSRSNSFKNNIFLGDAFHWSDGYFPTAFNNEISNNIFKGVVTVIQSTSDGNIFYNNVFVQPTPNFGLNPIVGGNYLNVPIASIFVNYTGGTFDYLHNYQLQNPGNFVGSDGTQVGIFGGLFPFKEGGIPVNPRINSKNIAPQTNPAGQLGVQINVSAQDK